MPLHWPNRVWTPTGFGKWYTREPTAMDKRNREECERGLAAARKERSQQYEPGNSDKR